MAAFLQWWERLRKQDCRSEEISMSNKHHCRCNTIKHRIIGIIWGRICAKSPLRLHFVEGMKHSIQYIQESVGIEDTPSAKRTFLMHDRAPCNRSKILKKWALPLPARKLSSYSTSMRMRWKLIQGARPSPFQSHALYARTVIQHVNSFGWPRSPGFPF